MTISFSHPEVVILVSGVLIAVSVLANRLSSRLGIPLLVIFLSIGMLAGAEGPGKIVFNNKEVASFVGLAAVAIILFSGGLETHWKSIRPILWRALTLATLGSALTALFLALFAWLVLGMPFLHAFLLGSTVCSTDAPAVFAVMRSPNVNLNKSIRPLLEAESGSNDPIAFFLTVTALTMLAPSAAGASVFSHLYFLLPKMALNLCVGLACGAALGYVVCFILRKFKLEYEGLYPLIAMSCALITYGLTDEIHGSGLMAVYALGLILGNLDYPNKRYIMRFHEGFSWLLQIVLFVALGLLVKPSELIANAPVGLAVAAFMVFVARPLAIHIGLLGSQFSLNERTLIAWAGLRGAVPIVFAVLPFAAGYERADEIFNIVFFVVVVSVLFQGTTLMPLARLLKVDTPPPPRRKFPLELEKIAGFKEDMEEVEITPDSAIIGTPIAKLGLAREVLILLIHRDEYFIVPRGQTVIQAFDNLMLLGPQADLDHARKLLLSAAVNESEKPLD